jgi:hypothetical protein
MKAAWNRDDLTGKTFGNVYVISLDRKDKKALYWKCKCSCGHEYSTRSACLKREKNPFRGCRKCGGKSIGKHRWIGHGEISGSYFTATMHNAKSRKIGFDVTIEYIWEIFLKQERKCALSGEILTFSRRRDLFPQTASLDRIDNTKGYIKGNVQWVHKDVNEMRMNRTKENFIEWCHKISNYQNLRK